MRKYFTFLVFVVLSVLVLGACSNKSSGSNSNSDTDNESSSNSSNQDVITIKVAHIAGPEEPYSIGFEHYAAAVEEATDNRVKFEIFGNGEMGGEADVAEQIQMGSVDMSIITTGVLGDFYEDLSVLDLPFLFRDVEHAYKVLDSDFGQELLDGMQDIGFKSIAFWENGVRHISNNERPVYTPEDMKGLKMRTVENNIFIDTYKSFGAEPVPMAFPEVYSSLQQGVIDGNDQPYTILSGKKIFEVQEYLTELGLYYASATLVMNNDFYDSLPADIQEIIIDLGKEYAIKQRQIAQDTDLELKEELMNELEIVELEEVDMDAFIDAVQPLYDELDDKYKEYVETIKGM